MKIIEGNITAPKGFLAAGCHVGLKKVKKDLALIFSEVPAAAAGCFTKNIVKAAPVHWDMKIIEGGGKVKAIAVNSGNANACTGEQGKKDAKETAEILAALAGCKTEEVLVASTGVIGVNLPMDILKAGIKSTYGLLGNSADSGRLAAEAIMTTDTFAKTATVEVELSGKKVLMAGMAKGSGMINPNMATLLAFVTTDASISRELLQEMLSESVTSSYNMITVDGDTSTNDSILVLANGAAGNEKIVKKNEDYETLKQALDYINRELAIKLARDGEGATKLMEVSVKGAADITGARKIAKSVLNSSLFKAALFGADANWGRVLCAMGYSGADFDPERVNIIFKSSAGEILLMDSGRPVQFDEALAKNILLEKEIKIEISLSEGQAEAVGWGCDLTYDYVKINGDYRS